jgi:hypothetical protein
VAAVAQRRITPFPGLVELALTLRSRRVARVAHRHAICPFDLFLCRARGGVVAAVVQRRLTPSPGLAECALTFRSRRVARGAHRHAICSFAFFLCLRRANPARGPANLGCLQNACCAKAAPQPAPERHRLPLRQRSLICLTICCVTPAAPLAVPPESPHDLGIRAPRVETRNETLTHACAFGARLNRGWRGGWRRGAHTACRPSSPGTGPACRAPRPPGLVRFGRSRARGAALPRGTSVGGRPSAALHVHLHNPSLRGGASRPPAELLHSPGH